LWVCPFSVCHRPCREAIARGRGAARSTSEAKRRSTSVQKAGAGIFLGDHSSWGFGVSVIIRSDDLAVVPGRFGWDGGLGTSGYSDPKEDMVGILMTQRLIDSPESLRVFLDFWTSAYQTIDD
jgi:CubicO group peptidase (beta-lactamase class C family)